METIITKSPSYLYRKGYIYYFRIAVPYPLRSVLRRSEIRKSLHTGYLRQARTKSGKLAVIMQSLFNTLMQREMNFMADLTLSQVEQLADKWLQKGLEEIEDSLLREKPMTLEEAQWKEDILSMLPTDCIEDLYCNNFKSLEPEADALLQEEQLTAPKNSTAYLKLLRELRIRQIQCIESEIRYRQMETNWKPEKVTAATPSLKGRTTPSVKVSAVVEEYIEERLRMAGWGVKSKLNNPPVLRDFVELIGDPYIEEINRELIQKYKRDVARLPKRLKQTKCYKDKSLKDILKMDIPESERLATKTVSNRYRITRTFLSWTYMNGYDIEERCVDILKNTGKKSNTQSDGTPFTVDELHKLFHSIEYTNDKFNKPNKFWVPVIALFTGARIEEICQLHLDDLIEEDGIWCFDFNQQRNKSIKTSAGIRKVPIHPFLLNELNILGYVEQLQQKGATRLFPELSNNKKTKKYSDSVSKWFTRYRREQGVEPTSPKERKVFHSFRNTFISRCYELNLPEDKIQDVVGHAHGNVTAGVYRARPSVQILYRNIISKVSYKIDLSHLKKSSYVVQK